MKLCPHDKLELSHIVKRPEDVVVLQLRCAFCFQRAEWLEPKCVNVGATPEVPPMVLAPFYFSTAETTENSKS